jgi:hypothetical protein
MDALAAAAATAATATGPVEDSAGQLADRLIASLTDGANDDDIAVLCISR